MDEQYTSALLGRAVDEFAKLPGVGRKTAMRLVLHTLRMDERSVDEFCSALSKLRHEVRYCKVCHNVSDSEVCALCSSTQRDRSTVCVVENVQDVMAIEATMQYRGLYHVLGGVISPMDGIGPGDLEIQSLLDRVAEGEVKEVILGLSSTMEGDTTNFYISKRMEAVLGERMKEVKLTVLARGMSINDELQYTDEATLGRSIVGRVAFGQ